jgi:hypothetical protein
LEAQEAELAVTDRRKLFIIPTIEYGGNYDYGEAFPKGSAQGCGRNGGWLIFHGSHFGRRRYSSSRAVHTGGI